MNILLQKHKFKTATLHLLIEKNNIPNGVDYAIPYELDVELRFLHSIFYYLLLIR